MAEDNKSLTDTLVGELVDNAKDFLTENAKNVFMQWLKETGLPKFKEVTDAYIAELKTQADQETGWNKFRDATFVPMLISAGYWAIDKMMQKMVPDAPSTEEPKQ